MVRPLTLRMNSACSWVIYQVSAGRVKMDLAIFYNPSQIFLLQRKSPVAWAFSISAFPKP